MPYGIDKKHGGDSPANVKRVEKCVNGITGINKRTGKAYTKSEKIAICKAQLKKSNQSKSSDIVVEDATINAITARFGAAAMRLVQSKKAATQEHAVALCEKMLAKANYNIDALESMVINEE